MKFPDMRLDEEGPQHGELTRPGHQKIEQISEPIFLGPIWSD